MLRRGMADDLFRVQPEPDELAAVLYQHFRLLPRVMLMLGVILAAWQWGTAFG